MKIDAYGRRLEILREDGEWAIFLLGEGKKRRTHDISIPSDYNEAQVVTYIADLLHEAATPEKPDIIVIE